MHISEAPPGAVTKCASEEEPLATEGVKDAERRPSATPGGRLKFFKGKHRPIANASRKSVICVLNNAFLCWNRHFHDSNVTLDV